jgi:inosose dehydratase
MKDNLQKHNLEMAALVHVEDWRNPIETDQERQNAAQWMEFLSHFPDTIYLLVQMPGSDRNNLEERQQNLLSCVNAIAQRATDQGIICSYHPNSPEGSVYRTQEDYKILLNGLNNDWIGYTPDVGHIAKVDMDPMEIVKEYRDLINLVHYKDMYSNGAWAPTGEGFIDIKGITQYLIDTNFEGWIVMEDECDQAIIDPDGVTFEDGVYIESQLNPMLIN